MLNDRVVKNVGPKERRCKLKDSNGLVLDVTRRAFRLGFFATADYRLGK